MNKQEVGTIVGSSVHLTGAIKDSSDITIFGSIEGEINSDQKVIIEESAHVKGPINASEVIVSGRVVGTIIAKQRIELNPTGTIKGNVDTSDLLIHSGATFIGECKMPDKKSADDADDKEISDDIFQVEKESAAEETAGLKEREDKDGDEDRDDEDKDDVLFGKDEDEEEGAKKKK